jgi:hypothetical protein
MKNRKVSHQKAGPGARRRQTTGYIVQDRAIASERIKGQATHFIRYIAMPVHCPCLKKIF